MLSAIREGGDIYEVFQSREEAKRYADSGSAQVYIVCAGRTTGVMTQRGNDYHY